MTTAGLTGYTAADDGSGNFTITRTGNTAAVQISNADAVGADCAASRASTTNGTAGSAAAALVFQVDGNTVTLNGNYADANALATAIDGQLANYTVCGCGRSAHDHAHRQHCGGCGLPGANAAALAAGIGAGTTAGVAGTAAGANNNAAFTVDGNAISLTTDVTNMAGLVTAVQNQLNTAAAGEYTVSGAGGKLTIAKTDAGTTATGVNGPAIVTDTGGGAVRGYGYERYGGDAGGPGDLADPDGWSVHPGGRRRFDGD